MDVHRARFVSYPTSAITALAFTRPHDRSLAKAPTPALRLAVGREDGSIEIWNPNNGAWVQDTILHGETKSIDGLAWTQDPDDMDGSGETIAGQYRLVSIASSPSVTEWDLQRGTPRLKSTGNFSEIWSLAAQPREEQQKPGSGKTSFQDLAVGCNDGSVALLTTAGGDLQFKRFLARVSSRKARCMCITYQNGEVVLAGFEDSVIRVYDTRSGSLLRSMSFGVGLPGAPRNILIWKIQCLPSGDIVSADSNGEVRIWDGKMYALRQRIKAHDTDCLDLICSADGDTVMSASIDGKLAVLRRTKTGTKSSWAKTSGRRLHRGEFKAMASYDGGRMSVVVSGGSGAAPIALPLREYGRENPRSLPYLPSTPPVTSAPKARVLVSWWQKDILLWRISRADNNGVADTTKPHKLIARMTLDLKQNIRSVAISPDGKTLAASNSDEVKLFQLRQSPHSSELAFRKIALPRQYSKLGARSVSLSPDGKWLAAVTPDSEVHVARIAQDPEHPKLSIVLPETVELERGHRKTAYSSAFRTYDRTITKVAFSSGGTILAVSDQSGYIDSWLLHGHEDLTAPAVDKSRPDKKDSSPQPASDSDSDSDSSDDDDDERVFYGQHWVDNPSSHLLPKLESPALVFTFRPTKLRPEVNGNPGVHATRHNPHARSHDFAGGQGQLFVLTAKHQMWEMDVLAGKLSAWSRRNPTARLPDDFRKILDRAVGAVWDTKTGDDADDKVWIYGHSWMFMLNVSRDLDSGAGVVAREGSGPAGSAKKRKRKHAGDALTVGDEEGEDPYKRARRTGGAGGKIGPKEQVGLHRHALRVDGRGVTKIGPERGEDGLEGGDDADADDDDDFGLLGGPDDLGDVGLTIRRHSENGDDEQRGGELVVAGEDDKKRAWWSTFRYRPILGIVPLEQSADEGHVEGEGGRALEVVVVERPQKQE